MAQGARERALGHFAAGANDVLVATDVAARGLDLEHITHVINYDPPADERDYLHRVGRTARAGRTGTGITFVTPEKTTDVGKIATALKLHTEFGDAGLRVESVRRHQSTRPRPSSGRRPRPARRGR
jgi:superfamily II DNA/RNA helicase